MSTLESCERDTSSKKIRRSGIWNDTVEEVDSTLKPFDAPEVGDFLKRVN